MTRRSALRAFAGAGAALLAVAAGGESIFAQASTERHTSTPYTVTANLNLRAKPNTTAKVLLVMPKGSKITLNAQESNGFYSVNYKGTNGWAYATYIVPAGSADPNPVISGTAWTAAYVNLRSGPGTSYAVLQLVPKGSQIGTSTSVKNGFRYVSHQGQGGWMADAYISAANPDDQGGNYRTATANLNLRAEPSTSAKVLTVIPAGAKVQLLHTQVGQFGNVNYGGYQGWAALAYLK